MRDLTDGRDERRGERVVRESEQDARLAHARVADQQQFEQQVVRLLGHGGGGGGGGACLPRVVRQWRAGARGGLGDPVRWIVARQRRLRGAATYYRTRTTSSRRGRNEPAVFTGCRRVVTIFAIADCGQKPRSAAGHDVISTTTVRRRRRRYNYALVRGRRSLA